jgi:hypothetical protein
MVEGLLSVFLAGAWASVVMMLMSMFAAHCLYVRPSGRRRRRTRFLEHVGCLPRKAWAWGRFNTLGGRVSKARPSAQCGRSNMGARNLSHTERHSLMAQDEAPPQEVQNLPAPRTPKLPDSYHEAKKALAKCLRVDECKEWADKAGAVKSYAYISKDRELLNSAKRVQAVAAWRGGELLMQFDGRPQNAKKQSKAKRTLFTQKEVAEKAGLSKQQKDTFLRVAKIPRKEFEAIVESDTPPSLNILAKLGTKKRASGRSARDDEPADCRDAVERALQAMLDATQAKEGQNLLSEGRAPRDVEPSSKARMAFISTIERYPRDDFWWVEELVSHTGANLKAVDPI